MKKLLFVSVVFIAFGRSAWINVQGPYPVAVPPQKEVLQSDTTSLFIRVAIFGFNSQDTVVDNKTFKQITIPKEMFDQDTTKAGKPGIPYIKLEIAIPDSCEYTVMVEAKNAETFNDYLLYPIPRVVFGDSGGHITWQRIYTYDTSFYQKDTVYPAKLYTVNRDDHWRHQRILEVFLYPVQFNPAQEIMTFINEFTLRIEYQGRVVENTIGLGPFENLAREMLLNYPGVDLEPGTRQPPAVHYYTDLLNLSNQADYIIVTHEQFLLNETSAHWINEFAQWRVTHNQFDVAVVTIQDIYEQFPEHAPDQAAQLKDFLIYAYKYWNTSAIEDSHYAYCLFIGDWDFVPTKLEYIGLPQEQWVVANEYQFMNLVSNNYVDIMLGRWPVKTVNDIVAVTQKTINYEKYPDIVSQWRHRGLLIAGHPSGGFDGMIEEAKPLFSDIDFDTLIVRQSGISAEKFRDSVNYYLNLGELLVAYYDHGAPNEWYNYDTTQVKNLNNGTRLPVVLNYACWLADFTWDHPGNTNPQYPPGKSFGEHFLLKENGGCVGFFGATRNHYPMMGESLNDIFENILRRQYWHIGEILPDACPIRGDYCYLGDPALDLGDYTAYPMYPDLVIRPRGIDTKYGSPFPYQTNGDIIPVTFSVWNIGAQPASNIDVKVRLKVPLFTDTATIANLTIPQINSRDSVTVTFMWDPTVYPLDNGQTITLPDDYFGEIGDGLFTFVADPDNEIIESWEGNNRSKITKKLAIYPNKPNWSKKINNASQPAIGDINGNGQGEVVVCGLDSIYAYDPSGTLLSGWPKYLKNVHGIVLGDINNDYNQEIVAVSNSVICAYDFMGNVMYGWPVDITTTYPNYTILRKPSLARFDPAASNLEIIVIAEPPLGDPPEAAGPWKILVYSYMGWSDYAFNTIEGIPYSYFIPPISAPTISDVNNDGNKEIVLSYSNPWPHTRINLFNINGLVGTLLDYGGDYLTPALADENNDLIPDILSSKNDNKMVAFDFAHNSSIWEHTMPGPIYSSPAVGKTEPMLMNDEIIYANNYNGILGSFFQWRNAQDGVNIPPWPLYLPNGAATNISPALGKIDNDVNLDMVMGIDQGYVYVMKRNRENISPYPLPLFGLPSSPLIGDIDGDQKNEIITSSNDGYVHVWFNFNSNVEPAYTLEWPQFHHDYQRTGLYGWVDDYSGGANPTVFSSSTTITLKLDKNEHVRIKIFDGQGNLVKALFDQPLTRGTYHPVWNGKNNNSQLLPNGWYFVEIIVKNHHKIIPVKIDR